MLEKVTAILKEYLGNEAPAITPESTLVDDLGLSGVVSFPYRRIPRSQRMSARLL